MINDSQPAAHQTASLRFVDSMVALFCLFGAPSAWFVALCGGFALATQPCVVDGVPRMEPEAGLQWTGSVMVVLWVIALLIALVSGLMAWRAFTRGNREPQSHERDCMNAAAERARFLALWGMLLGGVFALATAMTALGFLILPRCGGG